MKPSPKEPPVEKEKVVNPYAIARPHPTDLMLQRQTSFRGFGQLNQVIMMDDDEINSFHYIGITIRRLIIYSHFRYLY